MTPVQTQHRHPAGGPVSVADGLDGSGPRVSDDMTVEVALSVMAGARVEFLLVCDDDDQGTGSVTRAELADVRAGSAYTDRIRLRDVLAPPSASRGTGPAEARRRSRPLGVLPLSP
ncbi:hypothetical protein ACIF8T_07415 [Streptomyces sp. NPDC085946]|uniref:hypothetical protein n=1 Tax=Streptomyces sp. NPDC085946 TaxID=3365744 RepID=UPI0037CE8F0D